MPAVRPRFHLTPCSKFRGHLTGNFANSAMLRVYISSKGRVFTEKTFYGPFNRAARSTEVSDSPDRKETEWHMEGRSLVAYNEFGSGMRRVIVNFDNTIKPARSRCPSQSPRALSTLFVEGA